MNIRRQMARDFGAYRAKLLSSTARFERKDALGDIKAMLEERAKAFEEFKKANDAALDEIRKNGVADPVTRDKLAKIESTLAGLEPLNQKITLAEQRDKALKEQLEEQKSLLEKIETKVNRPRAGGTPEERKAELRKRVNLWAAGVVHAFTKGVPNLTPEQQKALQEAIDESKALGITADTGGGYLAPVEYVLEIIKGVTEMSPARSIVRVRQTASKSIQVPKRTGQFAAQRVSDQGTRSETTGLAYGMVEIEAPEMYALIDISQQNLEDSAFDLEAELRMESEEQFAVKEGAEFVSGTGIDSCEGINVNADIGATNSGSAATIADADGQANGMITLFHAIKTAYSRNATWILNRVTLGSVRKLKDADKNYIWQPGLALGVPNTILGAPYVEMPDMPNEGAGAFPVAFGDFRRAYTMLDRVSMSMLRDPYTQATSGNIRFLFRRRVGGRVVLAEAIRKLRCSA